jgi:hypothetical protein
MPAEVQPSARTCQLIDALIDGAMETALLSTGAVLATDEAIIATGRCTQQPLDALLAHVGQLEAALAWYAEPARYTTWAPRGGCTPSIVDSDEGRRARAALAAEEGETP